MTKEMTAAEIIKSLESRFLKEKGEGVSVVYHFFLDGKNGGEFTVTVDNGACLVKEGIYGEPKCVIKTKDHIYQDVELGRIKPQMAIFMGKIKVSNIGSMIKFMEMFQKLY